MSVGLSTEDLLQDKQVVMRILVFLALEKKLGVVEEILTVEDGYLVGTFAKLVKVELTVFSHLRHVLVVGNNSGPSDHGRPG